MLGSLFIMELQHEMISTTKMLERLPFDKFNWKPHEKSMTLGALATHIAEIVSYITMIVDTDGWDLASPDGKKPVVVSSTNELVQFLKDKIAETTAKLQTVSDDTLYQNWTLRSGDHVIFSIPRVGAIRSMGFSHLIHHRGQLSVYLRMLDISVPSIYGPSADEAN